MNQEIRRLNDRRNEIKGKINRLIAELHSVEDEMKAKMVENLTVDQLLSILTESEGTTETEEVTVEIEEVTVETEETETEETVLTAENIRQAVNNEIEQAIRENLSEEVEVETEERQVVDNATSSCPHIESDQVTYDMLTDEMHEAPITLVGVKHNDLYRDGEDPMVGDKVILTKDTNTANTYGRIEDGRTIGMLPQSDGKIQQLENIGARYKKNREITLGHPFLEMEFEIVGFIPGCFIFLEPINEIENEPTVEIAQPTEEKLEGTAASISEARNIFNNCKSNCTIDGDIIEDENFFIIRYLNHPAQSMEEYNKECCIEKA